jgi:hypothetical protein
VVVATVEDGGIGAESAAAGLLDAALLVPPVGLRRSRRVTNR